jgi:hypothetical protein
MERLQFQGRLGEKNLKAEELRIRIKGLVDSLRSHLDPFEMPEDLETELIASQALELAKTRIEYVGILQEIKAIKKALGKE